MFKIDWIKNLIGYDKDGNKIIEFKDVKLNELSTTQNTYDIIGKHGDKISEISFDKKIEGEFTASSIDIFKTLNNPDKDICLDTFRELCAAIGTMGASAEEAGAALKSMSDLLVSESSYDYIPMSPAYIINKCNEKPIKLDTEPVLEEIAEKPNEKSDLEFFDGNFDFCKPLDFTSPLFDFE